MKLKLLLTIICVSFLMACGGTKYSGTMTRQVGPEKTEQKAFAALKKDSEKEVTVTISDADSINPTFLSKCPALKFTKEESMWMAADQPCSLFKDNDSKFTGTITFDDKKIHLSGNLIEGTRYYFHEFDGTTK
ncbi:MAG TPA: hypothetical protein PKY59_13945 [Pyrinomonadaceae bacterium]|nr:hypothetical protein [Pyrinomonadaceae bacterium]